MFSTQMNATRCYLNQIFNPNHSDFGFIRIGNFIRTEFLSKTFARDTSHKNLYQISIGSKIDYYLNYDIGSHIKTQVGHQMGSYIGIYIGRKKQIIVETHFLIRMTNLASKNGIFNEVKSLVQQFYSFLQATIFSKVYVSAL